MKQQPGNLSILVLSQDSDFLQLLKMLLSRLGIENFSPFATQREAMDFYQKNIVDVCMLEVQEGSKTDNGINFANYLREEEEEHVPIIFLTPSENVPFSAKLEKFENSSLLSKELSSNKLKKAFELVKLQLRVNHLSEKLESKKMIEMVSSSPRGKEQSSHLFFRIGDSFRRIDKQEVSYFFAENRLVYAQIGKRRFPTNINLKAIEEMLHPMFLRCHKKYIVNVSKIDSIYLKEGKVKIQDELLTIGYRYRKAFLTSINIMR